LIDTLPERGLRYLPAPDARFHPAVAIASALRHAVRRERPDLIHAWDWWQCIDAYYAAHVSMRIPMVVTDVSMKVTRLLPKALLTTWGTPELVDKARAEGRPRAELILPPVDVHLNAPNVLVPLGFRERWGIEDADITLVTVSRLAGFLKGESLVRTIRAVQTLRRDLPMEQGWEEIKDNHIRKQPVYCRDDLKMRLQSALKSLKSNSQRIGSFFQLPHTNYAST
jgi:L-malate glycosyltransferase